MARVSDDLKEELASNQTAGELDDLGDELDQDLMNQTAKRKTRWICPKNVHKNG